jgi:hypothetical protein
MRFSVSLALEKAATKDVLNRNLQCWPGNDETANKQMLLLG